jgi:hypothetical protein
MLAQARQRAALVAPHQAGVADNVCGKDRALLRGIARGLDRHVRFGSVASV